MKQFYRLAGLALLLGLLFACTSPPPPASEISEEVESVEEVDEAEEVAAEPQEVATEVVEEPTAAMEDEEMEEASEEDDAEESSAVTAVDGPTHVAASTVDEALVERVYDQAKGADEPLMTIIEYGDFQ